MGKQPRPSSRITTIMDRTAAADRGRRLAGCCDFGSGCSMLGTAPGRGTAQGSWRTRESAAAVVPRPVLSVVLLSVAANSSTVGWDIVPGEAGGGAGAGG